MMILMKFAVPQLLLLFSTILSCFASSGSDSSGTDTNSITEVGSPRPARASFTIHVQHPSHSTDRLVSGPLSPYLQGTEQVRFSDLYRSGTARREEQHRAHRWLGGTPLLRLRLRLRDLTIRAVILPPIRWALRYFLARADALYTRHERMQHARARQPGTLLAQRAAPRALRLRGDLDEVFRDRVWVLEQTLRQAQEFGGLRVPADRELLARVDALRAAWGRARITAPDSARSQRLFETV